MSIPDNENLTPEQIEKLAQYQEVTGVDDVVFARDNLMHHNWNVEIAVQNQLDMQDSPRRSQFRGWSRSYSGSSDSTPEPFANRRSSTVNPQTSWLMVPQRAILGVFRWCYFLVSLPFKAMISVVFRLIIPTSRPDPVVDVSNFVSEFEAKYGSTHPAFFRGSYSQALTAAKSDLKFLVVYLHCQDHQHTEEFCSGVLSDPDVIQFLDENVVFWACSVTTHEGYKVSQALRENGYPFLGVIVLKEARMTLVARFEGLRRPAVLLNRVKDVISDNEAFLVTARLDRQEREDNAALRLQQDEDYRESLRADQEKARRKQQERDLERSIVEEKEKLRGLKIEWATKIPPEPSEDEPDVIEIVAKLPEGARLNRRFCAGDSLSSVFYYIFCHPNSPDRFQVTTNFPRRVVPCEPMNSGEPVSTTFRDFGLPQRSMLFVTDLDA